MPAGRPRKPNVVHLLNGNPSKIPGLSDRIEAEPQFRAYADGKVPAAPRYLSAEARKCWRINAPMLARQRLLTEADLQALACYCATYALWVQSLAEVADAGRVTNVRVDSEGNALEVTGIAPAARFALSAQKTMLEYAREFGMTPAARGRMQLPTSKEATASEMERLLQIAE